MYLYHVTVSVYQVTVSVYQVAVSVYHRQIRIDYGMMILVISPATTSDLLRLFCLVPSPTSPMQHSSAFIIQK